MVEQEDLDLMTVEVDLRPECSCEKCECHHKVSMQMFPKASVRLCWQCKNGEHYPIKRQPVVMHTYFIVSHNRTKGESRAHVEAKSLSDAGIQFFLAAADDVNQLFAFSIWENGGAYFAGARPLAIWLSPEAKKLQSANRSWNP